MGAQGTADRPADGKRPSRNRVATREVVLAAVELFAASGYESTTMEDIAAATGVSRRSLFRRFGSKEEILFSEHDELFDTVVRYLDASPDDPVVTVCAAARLVFQRYVGVPEITVPRYRLVRALPRLRDREIAMTARYQAAFSRYLARGETDGPRVLAAESLAASVIAAHNHAVRSWLREVKEHGLDPRSAQADPWARFDAAMEFVSRSVGGIVRTPGPDRGDGPGGRDTVLVAVYPATADRDEVLRRVGAALDRDERPCGRPPPGGPAPGTGARS